MSSKHPCCRFPTSGRTAEDSGSTVKSEAAQAMRTGKSEARLVACWTGPPCRATTVPAVLSCSAQPEKSQQLNVRFSKEVLSFPNLDLFSFSSPPGGSSEGCRLSRAAVPLAGLRFLCSWVALLSRSLGDSGRAHPAPAPYPSAQRPQPAHRREAQGSSQAGWRRERSARTAPRCGCLPCRVLFVSVPR